MTRVLDDLVAAGMITRTPHPTDGRLVIVSLTPAGVDSVDRAGKAREQWLRDQLDPLDPEARATLAASAHIIETILTNSDYRDYSD